MAPKRTGGRLAYPAPLREKAELLFYELRTCVAVEKELKRLGHVRVPSAKTISFWMHEGNWEEKLRRRDVEKKPSLSADPLTALWENAHALTEGLKADLKLCREGSGAGKKKPGSTSEMTQLAYAVNRAQQSEAVILKMKLASETEKRQAVPTDIIYSALKKHPKLTKYFDDPLFLRDLQDLITEEMMAETRRSVGLPG